MSKWYTSLQLKLATYIWKELTSMSQMFTSEHPLNVPLIIYSLRLQEERIQYDFTTPWCPALIDSIVPYEALCTVWKALYKQSSIQHAVRKVKSLSRVLQVCACLNIALIDDWLFNLFLTNTFFTLLKFLYWLFWMFSMDPGNSLEMHFGVQLGMDWSEAAHRESGTGLFRLMPHSWRHGSVSPGLVEPKLSFF